MPVNSISPGQPASSQPAQAAQLVKKSDAAAARKQDNLQESNKVNDSKDAAKLQAQLQKAQEPSKAGVNTNGQKIGTRINVSA
jgi:hypothetical protein